MASKKPPGRRKEVNKSCDVTFNGGLQSSSRSTLIIELVKYLMYQRNQIPLPLEHVQRELKRCDENQEKSRPAVRKRCLYSKIEQGKARAAVTNLELTFKHLHTAFEQCPDIRQVLILIGGTLVSPKETYRVTMPPHHPEAPVLSTKSCVKVLFRQLIVDDFLGRVKPLPCTNLIVLLHAPRDCGLDWFQARPLYKKPNRGRSYNLNLNCWQPHDHTQTDLSLNETNMEISGIEPLESSDLEISITDSGRSLSPLLSDETPVDLGSGNTSNDCVDTADPSLTLVGSSSSATLSLNRVGMDDTAGDLEDLPPLEDEGIHLTYQDIWFQSPVTVKGYKDKTSKVIN